MIVNGWAIAASRPQRVSRRAGRKIAFAYHEQAFALCIAGALVGCGGGADSPAAPADPVVQSTPDATATTSSNSSPMTSEGAASQNPSVEGLGGTPASTASDDLELGGQAPPGMPQAPTDMREEGTADTDVAADPEGTGSPSAGCGSAETPEAGVIAIDVDGTPREFILSVPTGYHPDQPYRLVLAWHGLGGSAEMTARGFYGLSSLAGDTTLFVAGQGETEGGQGGFANWNNPQGRDVAYARALLSWVKENYCVDLERVFSIGMSNGGMMSNVVGCELGDELRAIVALSGGGPRGYAKTPCNGQVAALISHGNTDNNVPFSYGEASRDYWLDANHCDSATEPAEPADTCAEYQACDDGFPVQFCEFDGGHRIPPFTAETAWRFISRF